MSALWAWLGGQWVDPDWFVVVVVAAFFAFLTWRIAVTSPETSECLLFLGVSGASTAWWALRADHAWAHWLWFGVVGIPVAALVLFWVVDVVMDLGEAAVLRARRHPRRRG